MGLINLLIRRRRVLEQELCEPTLLMLALTVVAVVGLFGLCLAAVAFLPAYGHIWWTFTVVAVLLAWQVFSLIRKRKADTSTPPTGRWRWFRRVVLSGRIVLIGVLGCWLGAIVWSAAAPGGRDPPPKTERALIRVVTWNIHCGQDEGSLWEQFNWPARKHALRMAVDQAQPDILCVQEARPAQVAFLEEALPRHRRVGVGRDDGKAGGEHSAVYFSRERFEELGGNTFWLEKPTDQPRPGSAVLLGLNVKRICTWVRLHDRVSDRTIRVYNTHLYLSEPPRLAAVKLIQAHIAAGDPSDAVLLAADFNSTLGTPSRRLFGESGLIDSAERAGKPVGRPTFHYGYGIGLWCIDGILVDSHWQVHNHIVLDVKPLNTYPSDHFGLMGDLKLPARTGTPGSTEPEREDDNSQLFKGKSVGAWIR
jgi:endonuclease/exonuclease/phosphatase family metal-dependent hydrolase